MSLNDILQFAGQLEVDIFIYVHLWEGHAFVLDEGLLNLHEHLDVAVHARGGLEIKPSPVDE